MHSLGPAESRNGSIGMAGKVPGTSTKRSKDSQDRDAYELSRVGKKDVLKVQDYSICWDSQVADYFAAKIQLDQHHWIYL